MRRLFTMTAVLALAAACSPAEEQNKTAADYLAKNWAKVVG